MPYYSFHHRVIPKHIYHYLNIDDFDDRNEQSFPCQIDDRKCILHPHHYFYIYYRNCNQIHLGQINYGMQGFLFHFVQLYIYFRSHSPQNSLHLGLTYHLHPVHQQQL